ncbi:cytochrome c oxidase subunit II [Phycicoccus endophyticus]|uniref:cytochrome-c oxidase n=1 Tax=Phycicoccus endophyticus TaxID=1690220 RepID=A0A7G9R502_9MICO|nr:cytochrome c oxidase subunit II [Phycicoccus endophyticus]NHI20936.1 cytochrome c oxidase subunit II [Phycicoccus endophyticus]QNN50677.1 cytochrome c oxidase subunit II [Phycicoccus endophyticus]GGL22462.1 cytochrome c oxidase subunit II [Phycicoccus endophyticus]
MRQHALPTSRRPRRRGRYARLGLLGALGSLTLAGCASGDLRGDASTGWLPHAVTEGGERVTNLWIGAWIAAIGVGLLVIGLIVWCVVAYRRRQGDTELPVQLRYNIPIEILYTVVPLLMVVVLFYYTARDENALVDTSTPPDVTINVVGKQWSWDFNYLDDNVHEVGTQAILTGEPGAEKTIPTLYLPVGERVEFALTSRDVNHSFWVPAFLQKMDTIPGRVNHFQVVPTQEGTFKGKCAELCGAYHSQMLFNVKVVPRAEYDQHMADLRAAGQTGLLGNTLNREQLMDGQDVTTGGGN